MKSFKCESCKSEFNSDKTLYVCPGCFSLNIKRVWTTNLKMGKGFSYKNGYSGEGK